MSESLKAMHLSPSPIPSPRSSFSFSDKLPRGLHSNFFVMPNLIKN
jgi:hypothetical protein